MSHHGLNAAQIDDVDATVVDGPFVRRDGQTPLDVEVEVRHAFTHPSVELLVGLANAGPCAAFRGHVAQSCPFVHGKGGHAGTTEFHAAVEGQLLPGMVGEDVEDDVLRGATGVQFAHEFETDGFGDLDEGESSADQVGVFGCTDTVGQCVRHATHAGVAVSGLDEVAHLDEFLSGHLVADAGRNPVYSAVIAHTCVDLEGLLQVTQGLDLVHEGDEAGVVVGVEQVVFEHGELPGVWQGVVFAVYIAQEGVDLCRGELVGIAALHSGDDRIVRLDALTFRLADEVAGDDFLSHGHWARWRGERGQLQFACGEAPGEGEESTFLEDEARHRVVA